MRTKAIAMPKFKFPHLHSITCCCAVVSRYAVTGLDIQENRTYRARNDRQMLNVERKNGEFNRK